jgi:hypothetical protein
VLRHLAISRMKASRESLPCSICASLYSHSPVSSALDESPTPRPRQQRHQLETPWRRDQLAALAEHVLLAEQAFDDGRARGGRAQSLLLHRFAQLVVLDDLPAPSIAPSSVASE